MFSFRRHIAAVSFSVLSYKVFPRLGDTTIRGDANPYSGRLVCDLSFLAHVRASCFTALYRGGTHVFRSFRANLNSKEFCFVYVHRRVMKTNSQKRGAQFFNFSFDFKTNNTRVNPHIINSLYIYTYTLAFIYCSLCLGYIIYRCVYPRTAVFFPRPYQLYLYVEYILAVQVYLSF